MEVSSGQSIIKIQRKELIWSKGGIFKVYINEKMVGTIETNGIEEFLVEPGQHRISIKMGWSKSNEIFIQSDVGKTNRLICGFNGLVINTIFILVILSFFTAKILEPFHLGIQMEKRIDIYYFIFISALTLLISFLPSAMAYIKADQN